MSNSDNQGPLAGIRVLDLGAYIAAPYGCALLADQGAEVIKIEPPGGDNFRQYPSTLEGENRAFLGVNRGKRGISLDLKHERGMEIFRALVRRSDVLVHNFRPSVPPRLGMDYESMKALNPGLIYCSVTGYGENGPLKDHAGYDQVLQAMTGMCAMQGMDKGRPEILYGSVVDYYAAALLAAGVASALYERSRTGMGQQIGVSLMRSALAMQSARLVWADGEPREVNRDMRSGGVTGIHPTREGYIYISANTPHFWNALCDKAGLPPAARSERYDTVKKRNEHAQEVLAMLHEALSRRSAMEWEAIFGTQVPCACVRTVEDMFDHPQVRAEGMLTEMNHAKVGAYRAVHQPIKFGRQAHRAPGLPAPAFGQHTRDILSELGLTDSQIESYLNSGALCAD